MTLVSHTGKALADIMARVAEMSDLVETIAVSARDRASGLREVNIAVTEMDKVTQQNAAMVEQSTAGIDDPTIARHSSRRPMPGRWRRMRH